MTVRGSSFNTSAALLASGLLLGLWAVPAAAQTVADDVVCTGCVDRSDIAPFAISNGKIGNGQVTTNKLDNGAVTTGKIKNKAVNNSKIGDSAVRARNIANGQIFTGKIANGAVTGDKIAPGAVGADKLAVDAVFGRILVVRNFPDDQVGNCDELQGVLASITDNDVNNRYTILLEPGIYDCETTPVQMLEYVDIAGSGRLTTLIEGSRTGFDAGGVVRGASNSELRHLSVRNTFAGGQQNVGIYNGSPNFRITDVKVETVPTNVVVTYAILLRFATTASSILTNVEAFAGDGISFSAGVFVRDGTTAELVNVTGTGGTGSVVSAGLFLESGATATARNSVFVDTEGSGVNARTSGDTVNLVSTQSNGGKTGPGTANCVGSYDQLYDLLSSTCVSVNPAAAASFAGQGDSLGMAQ